MNHISLLNRPSDQSVGFAVFREKSHDLFLNGTMSAGEFEVMSAQQCLQRSAFEILQLEKNFLPIALPKEDKDIIVTDAAAGKFIVDRVSAERFSMGDNVFLFGDAAGFGSPTGGLGLSLVSSVYLESLTALVDSLHSENPTGAADTYSKRVSEIIKFWHSFLEK